MTHPFMAAMAHGLADRGIASLRYQFPYMERGSKRPDAQKIAHATVRAAVTEARRRLSDLPSIRRRQIVRRPDDVTGAGGITVAWCARNRVPGIPTASSRATLR